MRVHTDMTMTYELVTPEMAAYLLGTNPGENRSYAKQTGLVYAKDILDGNWDEETGNAISIDKNGVLRDGQHRCAAVVKAGKPIKTWVCRNVSATGIYDNNRKRTLSDQISIMRRDLDVAYRQSRTQGVIRTLIQHESFNNSNVRVSPKQLIDYIDAHRETLDTFFALMPTTTFPKISVTVVFLALYLAYLGGVDIKTIREFYDVLTSGMSRCPEEFPVISYRNYLLSLNSAANVVDKEISRCQNALKKYMTKSCAKKVIPTAELAWGFPKKKEEQK